MSISSVANNVSNAVNYVASSGNTAQEAKDAAVANGATSSSTPETAGDAGDSVVLSEQAASEMAPPQDEGVEDGFSQGESVDGEAEGEDVESLASFKKQVAEDYGLSEDDVIVVSGTNKDDAINISRDEDGSLTVDINGKSTTYTAEEARRLIIDGGSGNDTIKADSSVTRGLNIWGGDGKDTIQGGSGADRINGGAGNDTIQGGAGTDYIDGGRGNDIIRGGAGNDNIRDDYGSNFLYGNEGNDRIIAHGVDADSSSGANFIYGGEGNDYLEGGDRGDVMNGGAGYDVMYGLGGNDSMYGGDGHDYIDGGSGNDYIRGGAGDDNLVGGYGDDNINGGEGNDLLVGCSGNDKLDGAEGKDKIISNGSGDTVTLGENEGEDDVQVLSTMRVPSNFTAQGDRYEMERIESDFQFLANTEQGQKMFSSIAATGHKVTVGATNEGSYCSSYVGLNNDPKVGSDSYIAYNTTKISLNTSQAWADRAPVISMYHEMCHSYNAATGTMDLNWYDYKGNKTEANAAGSVKGVEFQAVGIDNPSVKNNDEMLTENSLRELLGFEERLKY